MTKTAPLSLELWGWCLFFGVGSLVWHQVVVISVPASVICCTIGGGGDGPSSSFLSTFS